MITGAFLAEAAAAEDNKLNVRGGVLSSYRVGHDRIVNVTLVVLTQAEAGDSDVKLNIENVNPNGELQVVQAAIPDAALKSQNGFAIFPLTIKAEANGRYVLILTCGGSSTSLLLTVCS
jgi:hypothetical protein